MSTHAIHKGFRLSLNLIDLERAEVDSDISKLLVGRVDFQSPIRPDTSVIMVSGVHCGDHDETSLPLICELLEAAKLVDAIRARNSKDGDYPTRVYLQRKKKGPWERLSGNAILTEKIRGKVRLSTKIFPVAPSHITPIPDSGISL